MKKVLLFLIDSMMTDVLRSCLDKGKTPAMQFLYQHGHLIEDCVTVFPTMTASVDCSLITGAYPDRHKVPGLIWYDPAEQKIVNYLNGPGAVVTLGLVQCLRNALFDLNNRHLSSEVQTIHEALEEMGYTSGSINVMAHRGLKSYSVHPPFLLDAATGFSLSGATMGPTIFSLGALVKPAIFREVPWNLSQSLQASLGINDTYAIDLLIEVVKSGMQPDFTLIYLPDNDHRLHQAYRHAEDHLAQVDQQLVRFLDTFDSWEQAIQRNVFILASDHGQTLIGDTEEHNVDLDQLLSGFVLHRLHKGDVQGDEVVLCNNERMAYLYPLRDNLLLPVVEVLAAESRIDLVAWKDGPWVNVLNRHQLLSFCRGGSVADLYGNTWTLKGEWEVLDLRLNARGSIAFGSYPDALSRLYGALFSQDVPLIVITAAPGYEFVSEHMPTHLGGGSHGSLHKQDSLVPLLIAGSSRTFPQPARLVDMKSYILHLITSREPVTV